MGSSDSEGSLKEKKEKKDKKKDKGKDRDKDEKKDKKDKHGDEKEKKDKHGDEKKDKDKHGDEKDKDKKEKDKKDKDKDKHEKGGKDKDKDKHEKDKHEKGKDKEKEKKDKKENPPGAPSQPHFQPTQPSQSGEAQWFLREPGTEIPAPRTEPDFPNPNPHHTSQQPPQQPPRATGGIGGIQPPHNAPPSGYRIPLGPNVQFPSPDQLGRPPTTDSDGFTPVFIGSAIFPDSVHPCKITPSLYPPCRVTHGGGEVEYHARFDLLPITQDMEWVPTRNGQVPPGRRPIEGGYEVNGGKLYHALGLVQGVHVPGKTGEHLVSRFCLSAFGRGPITIEIL